MLETRYYLPTGDNESDVFPAKEGDQLPESWVALGVELEPREDGYHCKYVVLTGEAGDDTAVGPKARSLGFVAPEEDSWYYVLANCPETKPAWTLLGSGSSEPLTGN